MKNLSNFLKLGFNILSKNEMKMVKGGLVMPTCDTATEYSVQFGCHCWKETNDQENPDGSTGKGMELVSLPHNACYV